MTTRHLKQHCNSTPITEMIRIAMSELNLSARAYDRILKVARTIADLNPATLLRPNHISEAYSNPLRPHALGVNGGVNRPLRLDAVSPRNLWSCFVIPVSRATGLAQQLDRAAIRAAARYSATHHGTSFLSSRAEKRFREYPAGGSSDTPRKIYSGTKAFWNLAALTGWKTGLLKLDARVADTIPEWQSDPRKSRVTIRQLLDFSVAGAGIFSAWS